MVGAVWKAEGMAEDRERRGDGVDLTAVAAALLFGVFVGAVNGFLVTRCRIVSFVATLGTMSVVRGILLKGNTAPDVAPEIWPIALFAAVALVIGVKRYRQTLD